MPGWRWWSWLAAALLLAACGPAAAQPVVLDQASATVQLDGRVTFWVEPGRRLRVEEVEAQAATLPWEVRRRGQQHRLDGRTLWVRFEATVADASRWYLSVDAAGIDRLQLFQRAAQGAWTVQEAGDVRPVSQWPVPGRSPAFPLATASSQPVAYFLRVEHDRVDFAAPLVLYEQARLLAVREREQFALGAYFGLSALLLVVALAHAIAWRDRNFAAFVFYLGTFALGQAAFVGVGAQHLWNEWLEWNVVAAFLLPAISAATALWFVQVVTEPARFSRRLHQAVLLLVGALLVAAVADTWWPSRPVLLVRASLTLLAVAAIVGLIAQAWRKGDDPQIRLIALAFVPVLLLALFPIARAMNLTPNNVLTRYGLLVGSALEMPLLYYALTLRAAGRRAGVLRASALPHTDALTGLADRRTLLQRMEASLARAGGQKQTCALLVLRLANHDAIASEYGRDMLDRALVVAASLLRRCAADIDLAARVGEREFALLLEGPATPDSATARAQQLVAGGLRPAAALPPELTLRLQVVVALLPDDHGDAAGSLQWALASLGNLRADARKPIRPLNF